MLFNLSSKPSLEINAIPDRNPIFVTMSNGSIRNGYTIKIMNKTHEKKTFSLKISNPKEAILKAQNFNLNNLEVAPDTVGSFKVFVMISKEKMQENLEGRFLIDLITFEKSTNEEKKSQLIFIGK